MYPVPLGQAGVPQNLLSIVWLVQAGGTKNLSSIAKLVRAYKVCFVKLGQAGRAKKWSTHCKPVTGRLCMYPVPLGQAGVPQNLLSIVWLVQAGGTDIYQA